MAALEQLLPIPGPLWGSYPLRRHTDMAPAWRLPSWRHGLARASAVARAAQTQTDTWLGLDDDAWPAQLHRLRRELRQRGLVPDTLAQALAAVAVRTIQTLGQTPRNNQYQAAAALLDNQMAEMATGEGKTLAVAMAAAVAALAGVPVHVLTANSYLAGRDAQAHAVLFRSLGLRVAALDSGASAEARRQVYAHDLVYATAKDLAFDYLRDRQAGDGSTGLQAVATGLATGAVAPPLLRGLCLALLDEADSILLDEADVPLILAQAVPQAGRRAFLWQALALARQFLPEQDFQVRPGIHAAQLTPLGEDRLAALADRLGGPWLRPRYRREAVATALAALHTCHRNQHYLVRDGAVELLDPVTARVATGRVWSRGLHTLVALKEGLRPPMETETLGQTTFQRFFQRYWRLGGISGTLWEARSELHALYGCSVLRIPLHQPCRRLQLPPQRFLDQQALFAAVASRVQALHATGRPVLVGMDSVAAAEALSQLLQQHGLEHQVLHALHDADEAHLVARAGQAGCITVATRMAGRGTDILLDPVARASGGLHVLCCQHNASRRLDRQLFGRCARQGDPGSAEAWSIAAPQPAGKPGHEPKPYRAPAPWLLRAGTAWQQWREEQRRALLRASLLEQDLQWERRLAFAGPRN